MSTSVDAAGQLLFPASVERVESDGNLLLQYFKVESDGTQVHLETGRELPDWVSPRVQMPWHPTHLQDILKIFLRRNVGHGRVIEGLEVRWGLVVRVLQALSRLGPWNGDGRMVPMNQYYDPKLFDILPEEDVRWSYAPKIWRGDVISLEEATVLVD